MQATSIADATVTVGGVTYLANVAIQDSTPLQKLDLVSGRTFVWGFTTYNIVIQKILASYGSPTGLLHSTSNITINGHVFAKCYPLQWQLSTQRDDVSGKFQLSETLVYQWFKQNPPG